MSPRVGWLGGAAVRRLPAPSPRASFIPSRSRKCPGLFRRGSRAAVCRSAWFDSFRPYGARYVYIVKRSAANFAPPCCSLGGVRLGTVPLRLVWFVCVLSALGVSLLRVVGGAAPRRAHGMRGTPSGLRVQNGGLFVKLARFRRLSGFVPRVARGWKRTRRGAAAPQPRGRGAKRSINSTIEETISRFSLGFSIFPGNKGGFMLFELLFLALLSLVLFTVSMVLSGVVRIEKYLKRISEDFQMFINFYLQKR